MYGLHIFNVITISSIKEYLMNSFIKKHLTLFFVMGLIYLNLEVFFRSLRGILVGFTGIKYATFAGWTSLWMIFVGGFCGLFLGLMNEFEFSRKIPYYIRVILGVIIVFIIELLCGIVLNIFLKLEVWNYSNLPLNICGQISILYIPVWLFICPLAFWIDDLLRYIIYKKEKPISVLKYYTNIISNKYKNI